MPQIRPITDLRNTNEISEAEEEYKVSETLHNAAEALSNLRRKHLG